MEKNVDFSYAISELDLLLQIKLEHFFIDWYWIIKISNDIYILWEDVSMFI